MNMFKPTATTVTAYIRALPEPRKKEIKALHAFIRKTVPALKPHMVAGMIGYGFYAYKYATGREGIWPPIALSSRKGYISLYFCAVKNGAYIAESYRKALPHAHIGKSCVRVKTLEHLPFPILRRMLLETEQTLSKTKKFMRS